MIGTKARIINHETELNNKIVYVIEIQDTVNHQFRITKLRYSQVREIHEQIQKLINKLKLHIYLPQLPRRKLFGSTNNNENLIESRKKDLDKYLSQLLSCEKLHSLDIVKKYYIPFENDKRSSTSKQQINIQICIDRYTLIENVVIYYVRLRDLNSHQEWTFKTRYSQLRNVHDALNQSKIKNLQLCSFIDRPIFPKKKILGITNQSPQSIEKRRQQLEKYFTQIFSLRQVMNSEAIKYFIEQSKSQAKQEKQIQALRKKKTQLN